MRAGGVATAVVLMLGLGLLAPATGAAAARPCTPALDRGVLPPWARTGFSSPRPRLPHTVGRHHRIAALLFGDPLVVPPARRRSNKILWVSRPRVDPGGELAIRARRWRGGRRVGSVVRRTVDGGPGPSIIDLPAAGCWRFSLAWSGHRDTLDLRYRRR